MTHREEFQPLAAMLPNHYLALIDAAERVLEYKCECARAGKHCNDCVYGPLRLTLKRIKEDKNRTADGIDQLDMLSNSYHVSFFG
jgi:hypothetical protein